MIGRVKTGIALAAVTLFLAAGAVAYERELSPRHVREAYFLGRDTTFRLENFLKGYAVTLPAPARGPHVQRIAVTTPFKEMVDRARRSPDGYNAIKAEEDYRQQPPLLSVEVTLLLTPTTPRTRPTAIPSSVLSAGATPISGKMFRSNFSSRARSSPSLAPVAPSSPVIPAVAAG